MGGWGWIWESQGGGALPLVPGSLFKWPATHQQTKTINRKGEPVEIKNRTRICSKGKRNLQKRALVFASFRHTPSLTLWHPIKSPELCQEWSLSTEQGEILSTKGMAPVLHPPKM